MKKIFWAEPFKINKSKKIISKCLDKTEISGSGKYVGIFERRLTKIYKSPVCVTSSGTTALQLALLALDLKKDTEVIIPAYGYMAAANLSKNFNFKIKFCDVSENTFCIDIEKLKKKVTSKTKVVIYIHTYGFSSEIDKISNYCKKNKIILIEDTAEAFGSLYKNRLLGTYGDLGTLSFHASKTITTGEGGAIIVNNKKYLRKIYIDFNYLQFNNMNFPASNLKWDLERGICVFDDPALELEYLRLQNEDLASALRAEQRLMRLFPEGVVLGDGVAEAHVEVAVARQEAERRVGSRVPLRLAARRQRPPGPVSRGLPWPQTWPQPTKVPLIDATRSIEIVTLRALLASRSCRSSSPWTSSSSRSTRARCSSPTTASSSAASSSSGPWPAPRSTRRSPRRRAAARPSTSRPTRARAPTASSTRAS